MDIAPLGFAVDTKSLAEAADAAQAAAVKIIGVADAADKVAASTKAAGDAVKTTTAAVSGSAGAHSDAATAAQGNAAAHDSLATSVSKVRDPVAALRGELTLTSQQIVGYTAGATKLGATNTGAASGFVAAGAGASALEKDLRLLSTTLDPTMQRTLKLSAAVDALNRLHAAGRVSADQYRTSLAQLNSEINKSTRSGNRSDDPQHNPMGEFLRSTTYRVPVFGRELRRIVGEGQAGFPLGGIIAGAAGGMLVSEGVRMLMELPGKLADAVDETQRLDRQLNAVDAGGLDRAADAASRLNMSTKGAADALVKYQAALALVPAANGLVGQNAFDAAMYAGRVGGLDEQQRAQSADQLGSLAGKGVLSGGDAVTLSAANPTLANAVGKQLGVQDGTGLVGLAASGKLTGDALIQAAAAVSDELKRRSDALPRDAKEWELRVKDSQQRADAVIGDGVATLMYRLGDKINRGMVNLFGGTNPDDRAPGSSVTVPLPPTAQQVAAQAAAAALNATAGVGNSNQRASIQDQLNRIAAALPGARGDQADTLRQRQRSLQLQLNETPFGNIVEQTHDVTDALAGSNGQSGLISVWQQAIGIEREQEKQANGTAQSIASIVEQLKALKRAQQAVNDEGDLRKLAETTASAAAQSGAAGLGSYEQQRQALLIQQEFDTRDRAQFAPGAAAPAPGATPTATPSAAPAADSASGGVTLAAFLSALRFAESRNRDYDRPGHALQSPSGAMFAMQVLPSTAARPGYGVAPALTPTPEAFDRVGTDLATHWFNYFHGDVEKAAAAYHNGLGQVTQRGPQFAQYLSTIRGRLGQGAPATAAAPASGYAADLGPQVHAAQLTNFDVQQGLAANNALAKLVGDPAAFMNGGVVSGGSAGNSAQLANIYNPANDFADAQAHALQLTQQINEAIKQYPPEYRAAVAEAMRLNDVNQLHLKAAQDIYKLSRDADDNERRVQALTTGNPADMKRLELELQIEQIRESNLSEEDKRNKIDQTRRNADAQSQMDVGRIIGTARSGTQDLVDRSTLEQFSGGYQGVGDDLTVETKILQVRRQMAETNTDLTSAGLARLRYEQDEAEAILRQNDAFQKQLDLMDTLKGSYKFAIDTIGSAWGNMFGQMERTGVLHTSILLRGIEDGFYGMLDRIYQRLVISPLMSILDKLLNSLTGNLMSSLGMGGGSAAIGGGDAGFGGPSIGAPDLGAPMSVSVATGRVFGPSGIVPFARGSVLNTPTRFAYGGGAQGIAGEGPGVYEAIMPLRRGADGSLGVANHGGGSGGSGTSVTINDYRGSGAAPVEVQERESGNGQRNLEITLRDNQRSNVQSGRMDADYRGAYGISRPAISR